MSNKKTLDETKRERAMELLEESDPELAKALREELKQRTRGKKSPGPSNSIVAAGFQIHPSFWMNEGFVTWRLFRLNRHYRKCSAEIKSKYLVNIEKSIKQGAAARYFDDYRPLGPRETYQQWAVRVCRESPGNLEILRQTARHLLVLPGFLPLSIAKRLPKDWPAVPHDIEFPHPWLLDRLTPTSLGCAVMVLPEKDLKEEPFVDLSTIIVGTKRFRVNLNRKQDDICDEILAADYPGASKNIKKKIIKDVMGQVTQLRQGQKAKRDRNTSDGYPIIGMAILTLELYEKKNSLDSVAQELWPTEYPEKRKALRERVRSYLKYAQQEIDALIP